MSTSTNPRQNVALLIAMLVGVFFFTFVLAPFPDGRSQSRLRYRHDVNKGVHQSAPPVTKELLRLAQPHLSNEQFRIFDQRFSSLLGIGSPQPKDYQDLNRDITEVAQQSAAEWHERLAMMNTLQDSYFRMSDYWYFDENDPKRDALYWKERLREFKQLQRELKGHLAESQKL